MFELTNEHSSLGMIVAYILVGLFIANIGLALFWAMRTRITKVLTVTTAHILASMLVISLSVFLHTNNLNPVTVKHYEMEAIALDSNYATSNQTGNSNDDDGKKVMFKSGNIKQYITTTDSFEKGDRVKISFSTRSSKYPKFGQSDFGLFATPSDLTIEPIHNK